MIPFEFEYVRPTTAEAASTVFQQATSAGLSARYLGGGTELVTMARDNKLRYDVLIDLKRIPETSEHDPEGLSFGSCIRLSELRDMETHSDAVALVAKAAGGVADRTTRNSITLGGNICGVLPYREAVLPFLVLDGQVTLHGPNGRRQVQLAEVFNKRLVLEPGEFVVSVHLGDRAGQADCFYRRRTGDSRVDYPLITVCMARGDDGVSMAVTGAFGAPVLHADVGRRAAEAFESGFRTDMRGSGGYRRALLEQTIDEGLAALGEAS